MKKFFSFMLALMLVCSLTSTVKAATHFVQASDFAQWSVESDTEITAGAATFVVRGQAQRTTNGGVVFIPFSTTTPFTIEAAGGTAETLTPSAVTCPLGFIERSCLVTATFSYNHHKGAKVTSGDLGVDEAVRSSNTGDYVMYELSGTARIVESSSSASGTVDVPAGTILFGIFAKVTTTIVGPSAWTFGVSGAATQWGNNLAVTAGTKVGSDDWLAATEMPDNIGPSALTPLFSKVTTNMTAGAWSYTMEVAKPVGMK